ncbi:MAG: dihydrofolate reductase [Bacteroidota bacterium]
MIILIAAAAENNALGKNNDLIWHLPDDFKRFKAITSGHFIIMGRKTFESFPKPLPNRTHIIITRQKNYHPEGCLIADSLEKAIEMAPKNENVFVIGGGEIYKQALPIADKIELTRVHHHFDADTYFPVIDIEKWQLVFEEFHPKDEKHGFDFTFQTFIKK